MLSLVFLATFLCSYADVLVDLKGDVSVNKWLTDDFKHNFEGPVELTLRHNKTIRVCVSEATTDDFQLPANASYWNISCQFYQEFVVAPPTVPPTDAPTGAPTATEPPTTEAPTPAPSSETPTEAPTAAPTTEAPTPAPSSETPTEPPTAAPTTETPTEEPTAPPTGARKRSVFTVPASFALRGVRYVVGVAISNRAESDTVEFELSGSECPEGDVYNGASCEKPAPLENGKANFTAKEVKYFTFDAPPFVGSLTLSAKSDAAAGSFTWWARYGATPTATENDGTAKDELTAEAPRPGTWFFALQADEAGEVTIVVTPTVCTEQKIGPKCDTPYSVSETDPYKMNVLDAPGVFRYWKVTVNATRPLRASVRTVKGAELNNVFIYASKGQLPTAATADLINCNFEYCDGARILFFNATEATANETWFVATTTNAVNVSYGVWFDSICAQECEAQHTGSCTAQYPGYGVCVCATSSLTGVDCTTQIGIGPEYIVLIIIAALVIASALIGFIAWAYMRRKRVAYDVVS